MLALSADTFAAAVELVLGGYLLLLLLLFVFGLSKWQERPGEREVRCESCEWHGLESERAELERCPSCGGPTIPA